MNDWLTPLTLAVAATIAGGLLFALTASPLWLALALGSGTFAGLTWWSSDHRPATDGSRDAGPHRARQIEHVHIFRTLLDALPDAALVVRSDGFIEAANEQARDVLQLDAGIDLHTVIRSPELKSALSRAVASAGMTTAEVRTGVAVERKFAVRIVPLPRDQGPASAVLVSFRDRTSEAQLDQMRSDFVANASHELRTPLASLKGFIETLQGAAKDDAIARGQFLDIMQQEASRMSRLIDDLLSLSRIEMRVHVPPRDRVDLRAVVREVEELLAPTAHRVGQLLKPILPDSEVMVVGEKDELVQVAQNLVQNAIKYGKLGGCVIVRLAVVDGRAVLSVEDDGIGIANEHIPRLTERFYRVSAKHSRERGGTGLGLAIVKHIVNRHRGRLEIASTLGRGTTVTVSLPHATP